MTLIDYNTAAATPTSVAPAHRVYTRASWADAWTLRADIHCIQCVWSAAPNPSTATLQRHYGRVILPGASAPTDYLALDLAGQFVLVEWDTDEGGIAYWLGVIDSTANSSDGTSDGTVPAAGSQAYAAYGMERLLQVAPIVDSVWNVEAVAKRGGGAAVFNAGGLPNRTTTEVGGVHLFEGKRDDAEFWSTRDIVKYLLAKHLPTNSGGVASIPWTLANASLVPDWDAPTIEAEGMTVYALLNQMLDSRLLLGWAAGFDNTSLIVAPFSIASSTVTLDDQTFAPNATQHAFLFSVDPLTSGDIQVDRTDMVDQVIVRGARRVSVCTLRSTFEIDKAWETADVDAYNVAASTKTEYADYDQLKKRDADERIRRSAALQDVFALLTLKDSWAFTAHKEGEGEEEDTAEDVFPPLEVDGDPNAPFRGMIDILSMLPLPKKIDFSGPVNDQAYLYESEPRPILVTIEDPGDSTKRVDLRAVGESFTRIETNGEVVDYTISADVDNQAKGIRLKVNGAPQHVLAGVDFTPLPVDYGYLGTWSWAKVHATIAIQENRYCEATEPATVATADIVRRRVFHAGEGYQQIYIVPGTVVELEWDGTTKTSDGGYMRDDTTKLKNFAKLLAAYHTSPRNSLNLTSRRRTGLVSVGDLVATANGITIGAVVSRIQIDAPLGDGRGAMPPTQTVIASAVPVDYLAALSIASRAK